MYDRPVCATTTRLTKIKQEEKATVGVNLATHLYEFIRESEAAWTIRRLFRPDARLSGNQKKAQPELTDYLDDLEKMVTDAQFRSNAIYAIPCRTCKRKPKTSRSSAGRNNDGFNFGLWIAGHRRFAGRPFRHYNRFVMRLVQTAAQKCGDSRKSRHCQHIGINRATFAAPDALGIAANIVFPRTVNPTVVIKMKSKSFTFAVLSWLR